MRGAFYRNRNRILTIFLFVLSAFLLGIFSPKIVFAQEVSPQALQEQLEAAGGDELPDRLPGETRESLSEIGIDGVDLEQLTSLSVGEVLNRLLQDFTGQLPNLVNAFLAVLTILMLSAMVQSLRLSLADQPIGGVFQLVGMLCGIGVVLPPIVVCVGDGAAVLRGSAYFMLGCIPLLAGFAIASGKAAAGTSFGVSTMLLCDVISFLSSHLIVPILNLFLGFSIVSAISPNLNLSGLCKSCMTAMKWVLGLAMTIFSTLLTMQTVLGSSADVAANRTVKFVVSSFVPVVGSSLGEAFGTVHSCAGILKSGVGAFGVLAILFLFFPIVARCVLWSVSLSLLAGIADVFALSALGGLLRAISQVVSMMIAILLCGGAMLIVALEIVMISGGGRAI